MPFLLKSVEICHLLPTLRTDPFFIAGFQALLQMLARLRTPDPTGHVPLRAAAGQDHLRRVRVEGLHEHRLAHRRDVGRRGPRDGAGRRARCARVRPARVRRRAHRLPQARGRHALGRDGRVHHEEHAVLRLPVHQRQQQGVQQAVLRLQGALLLPDGEAGAVGRVGRVGAVYQVMRRRNQNQVTNTYSH